jgi:hypothetical protein
MLMPFDAPVPFDLHTAYNAARELFLQAESILLLAGVPHRLAVADAVQRVEVLAGMFQLGKAVVGRHAPELAAARQAAEPVRDAGLTAICYHGLAVAHARRVLSAVTGTLEVSSLSPFPADRLRDRWQAVAIALLDLPESSGGIGDGLFLEMLRAAERRRELVNVAGLAATPESETASDSPGMPEKDRAPLSPDERERVIADYLRENPDVKIKIVSQATGVSVGAITKTEAWRAEMQRREANRPPRQPRVHQLRADGEASILADNRSPADGAALSEESHDAAWRRIVALAAPDQRPWIENLGGKERAALTEYAYENCDERLAELVGMVAEQAAERASERRSPRRS